MGIGISQMYDTFVSVSRGSISEVSDTGDEITQPIPVVSSIPCTLQSDSNKLIVVASGQVGIDLQTMICGLADIQMADVVTIISSKNPGLKVGAKYLVIQTYSCSEKGLEHMEVGLKGGIL